MHPISSSSTPVTQDLSSNTQIGHIPVLYQSTLEYASVQENEIWIDCTLGRGGHSQGLLEAGARVIGLDKDHQALEETQNRLASYGDRFQTHYGDFRALKHHLHELNLESVDGILADIGVSSPQLDRAERGFSFSHSGPVDMRMDQNQVQDAWALIQDSSVSELSQILHKYGEEPFARPMARAIKKWADLGGGDTLSLAQCIEIALPNKVRRKRNRHPATRAFQALRIAVNDELGALESLLDDAPYLLNPFGRLLIISFHSLEDRLVKRAYQRLSLPPRPPRRGLPPPPDQKPPEFVMRPRKAISATHQELNENPRARSAKLRVLVRSLSSSVS